MFADRLLVLTFSRHALFVVDAIPIASLATAANRQDSTVIFHRADVDLVVASFHTLKLNIRRLRR
jgi:hypothetical protein